MSGINPFRCIAPDGQVIHHRRARRVLALIERDVERRSAQEVHQLLVADAVKRVATDLRWAIAGYDHIGRKTKRGAEQAYIDVLDDVESLTGVRAMPM